MYICLGLHGNIIARKFSLLVLDHNHGGMTIEGEGSTGGRVPATPNTSTQGTPLMITPLQAR